ncbi:MAG: 1,4-dihydroxy-2-naphthoate octaprenyltransferase [Salibacteraceae bacterium]
MRLRTLPLALASTLTGAFLVLLEQPLNALVLALTISTTVLLQINSNLANDYGDFSHGTDNDERVGPQRALQSGVINAVEMRNAVRVVSLLSFLSGLALLYFAPLDIRFKAVLMIFGLAAIYASVRYTAGSNPYGYRGLGDLSVMLFFGVLGVVGSYVCQSGSFSWEVLLPALAIGAFSTGVLNVNNTRDLENDLKTGKITLAVKMGAQNARIYHFLLLFSGMLFFVLYAWIRIPWGLGWLFLFSYPLFLFNALMVFKTTDAAKLDPYLKQLALTTFLFSLLLGIGMATA